MSRSETRSTGRRGKLRERLVRPKENFMSFILGAPQVASSYSISSWRSVEEPALISVSFAEYTDRSILQREIPTNACSIPLPILPFLPSSLSSLHTFPLNLLLPLRRNLPHLLISSSAFPPRFCWKRTRCLRPFPLFPSFPI